jgi:YbbR domain-containing protein
MPERNVTSWGVKLLSVLLALLFWFFVTWERPVQRTVTVPVRVLNSAPGMTCTGAPPSVQVVISGPRLTVALLRPEELSLDLDLSGAGEGVTVFPALEPLMGLSQELRATRISPARIELRLSLSK